MIVRVTACSSPRWDAGPAQGSGDATVAWAGAHAEFGYSALERDFIHLHYMQGSG